MAPMNAFAPLAFPGPADSGSIPSMPHTLEAEPPLLGSLMFDSAPYTVTEARLAVDLFDARTREAVWHGAVSLDASRLSGDAAAEQIRKAVHKLMQHYPPGSRPSKP